MHRPPRRALAALAGLVSGVLVLATGGAAQAVQYVSDSSFEATTGSPWTYTDTVSDPHCAVSNCNAGAIARTGTWLVWFGGNSGVVETGSATQIFTLASPLPQATLSYWAKVEAFPATSAATLIIKVDGTEVSRIDKFNVTLGSTYLQTTAPLPANLSAGSHTLAILFDNPVATGGPQVGVKLDDIEINGTPAPPAPDTTVTSRPAAKITKKKATIAFTSTIAGSTFTCAVDGKPAVACTSPLKLKKLKKGKHTVVITAVSGGVADPTPATVTFKVKKKKR